MQRWNEILIEGVLDTNSQIFKIQGYNFLFINSNDSILAKRYGINGSVYVEATGNIVRDYGSGAYDSFFEKKNIEGEKIPDIGENKKWLLLDDFVRHIQDAKKVAQQFITSRRD